eukprot:GEMP01010478.1.p1 GENE.GEMP01010478.1~~GEMP01010478.1.p1  ORF type:complete len:396 (+),score=103.05 GEMP01010478.1:47-1189(+)
MMAEAPKNEDIAAVPVETGYHRIPENQYGGNKEEWKVIKADYHETDDGRGEVLEIDGHPVMEQWEKPYMEELARVATQNGGVVLEVGFGLGLSATQIQKFDIDEHIIIEANAGVIERGRKWAKEQPHKVTFMHGLWQDEIKKLQPFSIDGVLYDTYPLTKEEQHTHQFDFIRQIYPMLKPGGILTYCNLTSIGVLRGQHEWPNLWRRTQVPYLKQIGFDKVSYTTVPVAPPASCEYYSHNEALLPTCLKRKLRPATFVTLDTLTLRTRGANVHAKVVSVDGETCIAGDEHGTVKVLLQAEQVDFIKSNVGKVVLLRNVSVRNVEGLCIYVDKWGKIESSDKEIPSVGSEDLTAKVLIKKEEKKEEKKADKEDKEDKEEAT